MLLLLDEFWLAGLVPFTDCFLVVLAGPAAGHYMATVAPGEAREKVAARAHHTLQARCV